jgi:Tol biopolymer transport system component
MEENGIDRNPDLIQVTLASSEYEVIAGGSVEIEVKLANSGPSDHFVVNVLGIPPGWLQASGPLAVWIAAGGQEKIVLKIYPPAAVAGILGSYPTRLYVFGQNAPGKGKEVPFVLKVVSPEKIQKTILLRSAVDKLAAAPGARLNVPLTAGNSSTETAYLEISAEGVPAAWIILPSPVITLPGGEEKNVDLNLQIPAALEVRAGKYPLKVTLTSQKDQSIREEIVIPLTIAAYESQGPVGVMMGTVQFAVAPGGSVTVPLTVLNRGLVQAIFRLGIDGIPVGWVSTSTPAVTLRPGEAREISMVIRPPLSASSQAGRRKFRIVVSNQDSPDQAVKVDCILTLAAFTQFSAALDPQEEEVGKPVNVIVKNDGNTPQSFRLSCDSPGNQLIFEYLEPAGVLQAATAQLSQPPGSSPAALPADYTLIQIPPGETGIFRFTTRQRTRPIMGSPAYAYQAIVRSDHKESPPMPGAINGNGWVPVWILAVFLILCLWMGFSASFSFLGNRFQSGSATQTAAAATAQVIGATQTIVANQTAAAAAGLQDTDGDGLTNQQEAGYGTDPNNADTDRDGLIDGDEIFRTSTNALVPDSDGDGLLDGDEVKRGTNPLNPDTDGDSSRDGDEVRLGTNPLNTDTDSDGLPDGVELGSCPNPLNPDSDHDGIIDGRDLSPCDAYNPALTATGVAGRPTATFTPPPTASFTPPPIVGPSPTPSIVPIMPTPPLLPKFSGLILFDSGRDGNQEVYTLDSSGQVRRMTNSPAADIQGVWDPTMRRIAFTSNRDGQNEIYIMNADGTNPINLTNNPADDQQPAWSSDGAWILFATNRDGNYELYGIRVDNLETRNLTNNPASDTQPSWIRSRAKDLSGDYILFTSNRDGNQEIYRMKSDGTGAVNLTMNPASDQLARGSPDGALVAFTSDRTGNMDVFEMRLDGQGLVDLTNNPASDYGPVWSSDQAWIGFTSDRTGNRDVYILKPSLPDLYNVTNNPSQDQVSDWR